MGMCARNHVICLGQATMAHLRYMEQWLKPRICISENVTTGNIGERVCEVLNKSMDSQVPQLNNSMDSKFHICFFAFICVLYI